ncbi:hypothetical protein CW751_03155 [Brumimicrobium salinarum]|uniref:DUF479 domain-containing protein n=1 Tax=Brumimicrobium salinarum TaxID=2058658 RepID=A0A2I0R4Q3_9FLAO|nr:ACP phosphodiesterase [Brumimicrobium salinarum]PKR81538.1 hypothetical protein CW751_03155 [Brumimicrobium salinarum]
MNYLGHLYFSKDNLALQLANIYGDFVKGRDYSYLPKVVQNGVTLHRKIDDYVDHHPDVVELRRSLYEDLPKIAGIAIDLYFDHLLAIHWQQYHSEPFNDFVNRFTKYAIQTQSHSFKNHSFTYPNDFIHLMNLIHEQKWIQGYKSLEGMNKAATGLSKRISFKNNLFESARVYTKYEEEITNTFHNYMKDAKVTF